MLVAQACKIAANHYIALMATFLALNRVGEPLLAEQRDIPVPAAGQVLLRVRTCGVRCTDLHVVDGELPAIRAGSGSFLGGAE